MTAAAFHEEWFSQASQDALAELVRIVEPLPGLIIEIGAWEGRSTVAMANAAHPRQVHSCDTWEGSGHEESAAIAAERDVYAQWRANVDAMTDGNVVEHRMGWRDYVPTITGPVALAFIDAEHSYVEVRDNIAALVPLMTPGGILCGDDVHHGPVQEAIVETLGPMVFSTASLWVWQMPTDPHGIDAALLRVQHPELWPNDADVKNSLSEVAVLWKDYTAQVSPAVHAVSVETAAYLEHVNFKRKPKRILDLGSGLSSAVLRMRNGDVTTVDTDETWMGRTREFLAREGLPTDGLLSLTDRISGRFDMIFVDIANGQTREAWARLAIRHLSPGGVIVFDDMQDEHHAGAFADMCTEHGITLYSLRHLTLDKFGRWAAIGVRDGVTETAPLTLAERYADNCRQRSDINEHLPRMVDLVVETNAQHVIELGTRSGVSTMAWLHGLEQTGGRLTSVDLEARPPIGDWPHWTFIQGNDLDPTVTRQLQPADIVFIDTSHHYRQTRDELEGYLRLVKPGGVICLHDTELEWPDGAPVADGPFPVKRALEGFVNRHGFACVNYPNNNGFAIVKVGNG